MWKNGACQQFNFTLSTFICANKKSLIKYRFFSNITKCIGIVAGAADKFEVKKRRLLNRRTDTYRDSWKLRNPPRIYVNALLNCQGESFLSLSYEFTNPFTSHFRICRSQFSFSKDVRVRDTRAIDTLLTVHCDLPVVLYGRADHLCVLGPAGDGLAVVRGLRGEGDSGSGHVAVVNHLKKIWDWS